MKKRFSDRIKIVKYAIFAIGIIFNGFLVVFPNMIPDQIRDRVLISFIMFSVVGVLFAIEELKIVFKERHEEIMERFIKFERSLALNNFDQSLSRIQEIKDDVFCRQVHEITEEFSSRLGDAEDGKLTLDSATTSSLADSLADSVEHSLKATVIWERNSFNVAAQNEYLNKLSIARKKRKVKIQRLFIIQEDVQNDPEFLNRVTKDQEDKVDVRYLIDTEWKQTQEHRFPLDFGIWDEKRVWVFNNTSNFNTSERFATLYDRRFVDRYQKIFEANWICGEDL